MKFPFCPLPFSISSLPPFLPLLASYLSHISPPRPPSLFEFLLRKTMAVSIVVSFASLISLFSLVHARIPGVYSGGGWQNAHATFYGGSDASGTMGTSLSLSPPLPFYLLDLHSPNTILCIFVEETESPPLHTFSFSCICGLRQDPSFGLQTRHIAFLLWGFREI